MNPERNALEVSPIWSPAIDPSVIVLAAAPPDYAGDNVIGSGLLAGTELVAGTDGRYRLLRLGDAVFSLILLDGADHPDISLAAQILLDDLAPDRIEALARFSTALRLRAPPDPRLTAQRRHRLGQILRVFDARRDRTNYRIIAEALFPQHRIDGASWAGNALRETTIRLARDGLKLVEGGYRAILRRHRKR